MESRLLSQRSLALTVDLTQEVPWDVNLALEA